MTLDTKFDFLFIYIDQHVFIYECINEKNIESHAKSLIYNTGSDPSNPKFILPTL